MSKSSDMFSAMVMIGLSLMVVALAFTVRNLKYDIHHAYSLRDQAIEMQKQSDARADSLERELRFFERYVRPDSTVIHDTLLQHDVDQPDSVTRWMISYGMEVGVSPRVLLSVAHVESLYNPRAVSRAGARGMFQVMAYWWWNVYVDECGEWDPYDAKFSTCYGAHILRHYLDMYDGDLRSALSAYNAGGVNMAGLRYARRVQAALRYAAAGDPIPAGRLD